MTGLGRTLRWLCVCGAGSLSLVLPASAYALIPTTPGPLFAAPEMAVPTPSGDLTGIGSDGADGVWFSDIEDVNNQDTAYLVHDASATVGLTGVELDPPAPDNGQIWGITPGLRGEEWFARFAEHELSYVTPSGMIVNKQLSPQSEPQNLVVDNQGTVWFTDRGQGCALGRLSAGGQLTEYPLGGDCYDLAIGPDGNIWVAEYTSNEVQELSATSGAVLATYGIRLPAGIATSGNTVWVTETEPGRVAAIAPSDQVSEYELPAKRNPEWLAAGPDGAVWFTENIENQGTSTIGRLTSTGELSEVPAPGGVAGIAATNDAIYFTVTSGPEPGVMRIHLDRTTGDQLTPGISTPIYAPPPVAPLVPPARVAKPCATTHGSIAHELLASLKCTAVQTKLEAECGFGVASLIAGPLKLLDAAKLANGFYRLSKVQKKLRPLAKLINDFRKAKFGKHAPRGFRTAPEVVKRLLDANTAYEIMRLLPDIAKAVSKVDYSEIALDLDDILGLRPCVDGIINAIGQ